MLDNVIKWSLQQRPLILILSLVVSGLGLWQAARSPIDVFPDLNRPRVVILTEAPGMAPEEVESLITLPIEIAMNGMGGVEAVRSSSSVGISVIFVEFDYDTDLLTDRQLVSQRLQSIEDRLPAGIQPQLAPMSSIMGQILMLGIWSDDPRVTPMQLRTEADWTLRQRLLTVPGVAQVFTMGGERKQYQVLVDPMAMNRFGVTLTQIEQALRESNENGTGGYLDQQGPNELMVRMLGRIQSLEELKSIPISTLQDNPILLSQVAEIREAAELKRGDSAAFVRTDTTSADGQSVFAGGAAVLLTISKQPGADTRQVTRDVIQAVAELKPSLPSGVRVDTIYSQDAFIQRAIGNVEHALRDGIVLVVIVLLLFLMNVRTTLITLTAIPLSLCMTAIVFAVFGLTINTMTLGGIAVAMGELVDDAIVDVENIFRRLNENRLQGNKRHPLLVVYRASSEVRRSIVYSTMIVILVFLPLFALQGMEGRLFMPLGIAYVISLLASLIVSLTVTPVLSYWLLGSTQNSHPMGDSWVLRGLKSVFRRVIQFSLTFPRLNLIFASSCAVIAGLFLFQRERDFLPPFNEGTVQLNVVLPPGTSLATSNKIASMVEGALMEITDIERFARRTGRAELDEHAEGVNISEYLIELDPESKQSREAQLTEIREAMDEIPGIATAVEQPIAHLISHMLSGVKAQVGIKIYGDDLEVLRQNAEAIETIAEKVVGVTDLMIEPQVTIPQLRIEFKKDRLAQYGLTVGTVNRFVETAMNGVVVSQILEGMRTFDLQVRMQDRFRENMDEIKRLVIPLPQGGTIPLESVANVYESGGPNQINRENVRRRIVIQCNVANRGVVDVVQELQQAIKPVSDKLPPGYYLTYEGQFQNQQAASRMIMYLFVASLIGVLLVLYSLFKALNLALQVMAALPMAFIGAVAALVITDQTITIAAMVGFISLAGIASRNGVLLLQHYLHLVQHENERFDQTMIVRAGLERLAPVLMTALTAGIALVPLVTSAGEPGKEILYPVATVILGGLISATLLDFFVHPALFWLFGIKAAQRVISESRRPLALDDNS